MSERIRRGWNLIRREPLTLPLSLIALVLVPTLVFALTHPAILAKAPEQLSVTPFGEDVPRLAPVRVQFIAPPIERDGSRLAQLEPATAGEYVWLDDRTLMFQPEYPGYRRGTAYAIRLSAAPEAGVSETLVQHFTSAGALRVVQTVPEDREQGVVAQSPIIVEFSRAVAPLARLVDAGRFQSVLVFDPPLDGRGEWVNTAVYRYTPAVTLPPNQRYTIKLRADLTSEIDGQLPDTYQWSFETYGPAVDKVVPELGSSLAGPSQAVTLEFNMPMDRPTVQQALTVKDTNGAAVTGAFTWENDDRKVVFQPSALRPTSTYNVELAAGARGRVGGTMSNAVRSSFTTVGPVQVTQTDPTNNGMLSPYGSLRITFNNPMDEASFEGRVTIGGTPVSRMYFDSASRVLYTYTSSGLSASSTYTARIAAGVKDRYGQLLPPFEWTFTTAAIQPRVAFVIPGPLAQYSSTESQQLYFSAINASEVNFALYSLARSDFERVMSQGYIRGDEYLGRGTPIRAWKETVASARDVEHFRLTTLGTGPLGKGLYYVTATIAGSTQRAELVFSVADTALITKDSQDEVLVWALDMATGQPVRNMPVRVGGSATQNTNADGIARFPMPKRINYLDTRDNLLVELNSGGRYGVTTLRWQSFPNVPRELLAREYVAQLYSDRVIFRPGETVELKGIVRTDDDAAYRVPGTNETWTLTLRGPAFDNVLQQPVKVNEFGTFVFSYAIPAGARLGDYQALLSPPSAARGNPIAFASFSVIEFRKPEFEVTLSAPPYRVSGEAVPVDVRSTYLFGGGVPNAPIHWDVTAAPFTPRFTGALSGYSFTEADPYQPSITAAGPRASGDGTTDLLGQLRFTVPSALNTSTSPQTFAISASVSDASAQAISTKITLPVFPADVVPGVRPERYVVPVDVPVEVAVVTVRPDQSMLPRYAATVRVYERTWVTTKELGADGGRYYKSTPVDKLVDTIPVTTDERGEARVRYTPRSSGSLRVVVEAKDASGRTSIAGSPVWVYGSQSATWRYSNDERFELVADKTSYSVGETAQVLVPAPYPGAIGLVTIERGKNIRQMVMRFDTNTAVVPVPIGEDAVPNIFVSVVLYRAPSGNDPAPRFNVGTIELPVTTDTRKLAVSIRADRDRATPRDRVRYDVKVTDASGNGVQAEVSLALVDKAIVLLADDRGPTGLLAFWFERGLGVNTGSSLLMLVNRLNDTLRGLLGDGTSKGGDGFASGDPRREFKNTAFWRAQVRTNERGETSVEIPLPDNVTTWRMQVRAVTADARLGESVHELLTSTSLIARPALPRFVRVGDRVSMRVLVQNNASVATNATVSVNASGVNVEDGQPRRVRIEAGRSAVVEWPGTIAAGQQSVVTFSAVAESGAQDSVESTLPILAAYTPEAVATSGTIRNDVMPEGVYLPKDAILDDGGLTVAVRQSLAAVLPNEAARFPRLPYEESTRYIVGRLRTGLAIGAVTGSTTSGSILNDVAGVQDRANGSGSFRDCSLCSADDDLTAEALIALGDVKAAGFVVNDERLTVGRKYLRALLDQPTDVASPQDPNRRAKFLYAIARSGGATEVAGVIRSAWDSDRSRLSTSGRAYLLMAMDEARIRDAAATSARSALLSTAVRTGTAAHWEEDLPGGRSGFTVLATSLAIEALSRTSSPPSVVRDAEGWLAYARVNQTYESPRETGQYARAVSVSAGTAGRATGSNSYRVSLNGTSILSGVLDRTGTSNSASTSLPLTTLIAGKVNMLLFTRSGDATGQIFYSAQFRYQMPSRDAEALNRGFAVTREITPIDAPGTRIHQGALGSTVRVKLTVAVSAEQRDVNISDLLPAGLEAINPRLRTTDPVVADRMRAEQRVLNQASSTYTAPWMRWYYSPWDSSQIRDDRIEVHARQLPKGIHEFVYFARATTVGTFHLPPTVAAVAGLPDVFGRGDSETFVVTP